MWIVLVAMVMEMVSLTGQTGMYPTGIGHAWMSRSDWNVSHWNVSHWNQHWFSLFGTVQSTLLPAEGSEVAGVVTSLPYWFQNHCLVTSQNVNSHNTNSLNTNS